MTDRFTPRAHVVLTLLMASLGGTASYLGVASFTGSLSPGAKVHGHFGEWEEKASDTSYTADSDGFVIVVNGSNNPSVRIQIGSGEGFRVCAFVDRGGLCPVAVGTEWFATGDAGVFWIPIMTGGP